MTVSGRTVYRILVLLSAVLPGLVVVIGFRVMLSVSPVFPAGFLAYYPVVLGFFGIVGLGRVAIRPARPAGTPALVDVVLLSAGILGAVLSLRVAGRYLPGTAGAWSWALLFAGGPVAIALLEIRRRVPAILEVGTGCARAAAIAMLIVVLPAAIGLGRIAAKEVTTAWYGRQFPENAIASARRIAGDAAYSLSAPGHPRDVSFDELDADGLLDRAFENHFRIGGPNGRWIEPHLTLEVGERTYRWSFRRGAFCRH